MKKMSWILLALAIILSVGIYLWYWTEKNIRVAPPVDRGRVVNNICRSLEGYVVDTYRNDVGEIGGYIAHTTGAVGASIHYYEADGTEFASASGAEVVNDEDLSERISVWNNALRSRFPHKETIECKGW